MKQVNLYEAKTTLSALVDRAAAGEEIVIAKNGKALAKLVAIDGSTAEALKPERKVPEFGFWAHYGWKLPDNFDDPDPEIEAMFYGDPVPEPEREP
jgi:prevent-host-death family protein